MKKEFYALLCCMALYFTGLSQNDNPIITVEMEAGSFEAKRSLPIDQVFYLKVPIEKDKNFEITGIRITKQGRNIDSMLFNDMEKRRINDTYGGSFVDLGKPLRSLTIIFEEEPTIVIRQKDHYLVKIFPLRFSVTWSYNIYVYTSTKHEIKKDVELEDSLIFEKFQSDVVVDTALIIEKGYTTELNSKIDTIKQEISTKQKEKAALEIEKKEWNSLDSILTKNPSVIKKIQADTTHALNKTLKKANRYNPDDTTGLWVEILRLDIQGKIEEIKGQVEKNDTVLFNKDKELKQAEGEKAIFEQNRDLPKDRFFSALLSAYPAIQTDTPGIKEYLRKEKIREACIAIYRSDTVKHKKIAELLYDMQNAHFKLNKLNTELALQKYVNDIPMGKCFDTIMKTIACDTCLPQCLFCDTPSLFVSYIYRTLPHHKVFVEKLLRGEVSFRLKHNEEIYKTDIPIIERYNNLLQSVNDMSVFLQFATHKSNCYNKISELLDALYVRGALLKKKIDAQKSLYMHIYNTTNYLQTYQIYGGNGTVDGSVTYRTKGKFSVRPDFGVGYYSNFLYSKKKGNLFHGFLPFWGVRFNFLPLDPNLAVNKIRRQHWFLHRSSVNISWSFISIGDGKSRKNTFENINLVAGYGYRINNYLNLSTGVLLFRAGSTEPFVEKSRIGAVPYLALTFDFDVVDALNDFVTLFKKK